MKKEIKETIVYNNHEVRVKKLRTDAALKSVLLVVLFLLDFLLY